MRRSKRVKRKLVNTYAEDDDLSDDTYQTGSLKRVIRVGDRVDVRGSDSKWKLGVVTAVKKSGRYNKYIVRFDDGKIQSDVLKQDVELIDTPVPNNNAQPVTRQVLCVSHSNI